MKVVTFLIPLFMIFACKDDRSSKLIQIQYDEVIEIHDEVMPETSTIYKLKKQIRELENKDSVAMLIIRDLEAADEAMMSWMHQFDHDKSISFEEQILYLKRQKEEIRDVSKKMKTSINRAKDYINTKRDEQK